MTARFNDSAHNKQEIEAISKAVRDAKMEDFCFVRDVENYMHVFDDPKDLWARVYDELSASDMLLIEISDRPSGGRMVETGMAYVLRKPVVAIKRRGVDHHYVFDGVADRIIEYEDYKDLSSQLKQFDSDRTFNVNDRLMLLFTLLLGAGVAAYLCALVWTPLALVGAVVYWLVIRHFFSWIHVYDRVVVYVPLVVVWGVGITILQPIDTALTAAWAILYWIAAVIALKKLKMSL